MNVLEVNNLSKDYEKFHLQNVSFKIEKGRIMGFIGRNGAGKSTTLKAMFDFVHPTSGNVSFFSKDFKENEDEIKQKTGIVFGGVNYYSNKKIKTITSITKKFYKNWDDEVYNKYLDLFNLDESKTPAKLSEGMKVKYSLALALSHHAELLILDEPTSGLDPVSREELLDIFLDLADEGVTILFSTHITSDLEKCADDITYIKNGKIIDSEKIDDFTKKYEVVEFQIEELSENDKKYLIGIKRNKNNHSALVFAENKSKITLETRVANLDDIMIHFEKEGE